MDEFMPKPQTSTSHYPWPCSFSSFDTSLSWVRSAPREPDTSLSCPLPSYVATPLVALLNVKEKTQLWIPPNATLKHFFLTSVKQPKQVEVDLLSQQSGLSGRQVECWFPHHNNQDRPSLLKKFRESSWRFTYYLIAFVAGMAVTVDKSWFYDLRKVWKGYPIQSIIPSQYWYYMIELSFYWSLLFSIAFDVKRKDFTEQIIYHMATIILYFSWFANYVRAGTLIMALHDSSDYLLESAKMFNYVGWKNTCNNLFIVFAVVFIITRLVIMPFWILHCTNDISTGALLKLSRSFTNWVLSRREEKPETQNLRTKEHEAKLRPNQSFQLYFLGFSIYKKAKLDL